MPESKRFLLRLDPRVFEAIRRWADDDLRSINAQIEYLLTEQARRAGRLPHHRARPVQPEAPEPDDDDPVLAREPEIGARAGRR
ncbi:MAG: hypothetical protein ACRDNJ_10360 [Solirubrobacteraceae bacterium]